MEGLILLLTVVGLLASFYYHMFLIGYPSWIIVFICVVLWPWLGFTLCKKWNKLVESRLNKQAKGCDECQTIGHGQEEQSASEEPLRADTNEEDD